MRRAVCDRLTREQGVELIYRTLLDVATNWLRLVTIRFDIPRRQVITL